MYLQYYVYAYIRLDGTPYYIGKGSGKRAWLKNKQDVIKVPKNKHQIILLETNLSEIGALAIERRLINWWGRKDIGTGILRNLTNGGDGASGVKIKQNRSGKNNPFFGKIHSDKTKSAIGKANCGKQRTTEQKERMSIALRNMPKERRNKLSIYKKNHPLSEESLNKIRNQYTVIFPNGIIEQTNNLTEFCKLHKLSLSAMRDNVAKGKQEHHKGYRAVLVTKA